MDALEEIRRKRLSRRNFISGLAGTAGAAGVLAVTGCSHRSSQMTPAPTPLPNPAISDADILNFALNLEYLEAEYYLRATTGMGLSAPDAGSGAAAVAGGTQVPFKTPAIQEYAMEIANDELAHVRFLRSALGSNAVARPAIDLMNSFNSAANAAGIGPSFNPFADEDSFVVGAFVFEDVGVTAYHGAATLLSSTANLGAAGAIMAVEASPRRRDPNPDCATRRKLPHLRQPDLGSARSPRHAPRWTAPATTTSVSAYRTEQPL